MLISVKKKKKAAVNINEKTPHLILNELRSYVYINESIWAALTVQRIKWIMHLMCLSH